MSSAERIRERFFHKIGIPPNQLSGSLSNPVQTNDTMITTTNSSCLGPIKPSYELLKVGLDDDSSLDDDEHDNYFFEDDELPTKMDIDMFLRKSQNELLHTKKNVPPKKKTTQTKERDQSSESEHILYKSKTASEKCCLDLVSDHASVNSSSDGTCSTASINTPFSCSTGKFPIRAS